MGGWPDIPAMVEEQMENATTIPGEATISGGAAEFALRNLAAAHEDELPVQDNLLAQANVDWLYTWQSPSMYLMTDNVHTTGALNKGLIATYLVVSEGMSQYSVDNADPPPYHRNAWYAGGIPGATGGGEGGIQALDPELIAGPVWEGPETEKETYNILYAMQAGFLPAIRPGKHGAIIPHPNRHTTIRIVSTTGELIYATTNILVEKIESVRSETFIPSNAPDGFAGYFGEEAPERVMVSGKLIDSANFDWLRRWEDVYDKLGRGSVLSKNKWRMYILYKAKIYEGYPLDNRIFEAAMAEPQVPFSFRMFITDREPLPELMVYTDPTGAIYEQYGGETTEDMLTDIEELGLTRTMNEFSPGELPEGDSEYMNPEHEG